MLTNQPVLYDFCVIDPISCLLTLGSTPIWHSVLNVKAVVDTFNQEKALVCSRGLLLLTSLCVDIRLQL